MNPRRKIKVKDKPDLVRDSFSKAIINIDHNSFRQYKMRKKLLREKDNRIASLENEIELIRKQQEEILSAIKKLNRPNK